MLFIAANHRGNISRKGEANSLPFFKVISGKGPGSARDGVETTRSGKELSNKYIITDPLSLYMLLFSILNA
jgi:hypothetical protein